jgi:putative endonuclease
MYLRHFTGISGEEIAQRFIEEIGMKIIECNFCCNIGEIDIIARDKNELVFIEVKTRTNNMFGSPSDAITFIKKKHIFRVAEYYIMINKLEKEYIRFDVIEVYIFENEKYKVNHIKAALMN